MFLIRFNLLLKHGFSTSHFIRLILYFKDIRAKVLRLFSCKIVKMIALLYFAILMIDGSETTSRKLEANLNKASENKGTAYLTNSNAMLTSNGHKTKLDSIFSSVPSSSYWHVNQRLEFIFLLLTEK